MKIKMLSSLPVRRWYSFRFCFYNELICFSLSLFLFVCLGAALSLPAVPLKSAQTQSINLFDMSKNKDVPRQEEHRIGDEESVQRVKELFQAIDPTKRKGSQETWHFVVFLGGLAVIAAGLFYWQQWQRKRVERELNDPLFLVYELNTAHQLSDQEKRLMQELSEKHSLPTPLTLFVEPKFLLDAWENETFASSQPTVQKLLSKLFNIVKA